MDDLLGGGEPEEEETGFFGEEPAEPKPAKAAAKKKPAVADADSAAVGGSASGAGADGPSAADTTEGAAPTREGYVVLARKYRPQTFDQIVGQENVQRALRGAIDTGQVSHAYLFSGPRGTGKTSTARILAKAVNCQNGGPRPDPCGRCASCQSITAGSSLDVIEIDAASNTGVDNIRELRSGVVLAPFSRYKVYIVDEVHMLSTQAFNALLKTLEEPPPQVIFILATTELHKVPETIISRCQPFAFRRFSTDELKAQLGMILTKELVSRGLTVTDDDREKILELVARNAEGGMRDAQVALDQVLVFAHGSLDFESVRKFLGLAENDALDAFLRAMHTRNVDELLLMVDGFAASGQDLELFVKSVCEHIRDLLIVRTAPGRTELVNVSEDRYARLREISQELPAAFLMNVASGFLRLAEEMKTAAHPRFLLELAIMRLAVVDAVDDVQSIVQRLEAVERALKAGGPPSGGGGGAPVSGSAPAAIAAAPATAAVRQVAPARATRSEDESAPAPVAMSPAPAVSAHTHIAPLAPVVATPQPQVVAAPTPLAQVQEVRESPGAAAEMAAPIEEPAVEPQPSGSCSAEELLAYLQQHTQASSMLHITLLDCTRILQFDGKMAVLAVDARDKFGFTHLNRPQSMTMLKDLARQRCGCDIIIKVETAEFTPKGPQAQVIDAPASAEAQRQSAGPIDAPAQGTAMAALPSTAAVQPAASINPISPIALANPAQQATDADPPQRIYMSPELREKTMREYKGENFRKLLEKQPELKDLVEKVKEVFKIDDAQFSYRAKSF